MICPLATRNLLVRAGTDLNDITTTDTPHLFRHHEVSICVVNSHASKVTFRGVPITVPDKELLYLGTLHGELVDGVVHRESVRLGGSTRHTIMSSNRSVEVKLIPGKPIKNFYWLTGPGQGEVGCRVLVLHPNQPHQCSWWF